MPVVGSVAVEVGEDLLETLAHRSEPAATEGEQVGRPLDVVEEGIDVDVVGPETGVDGPQLLERLPIGLLFPGHLESTVMWSVPSDSRACTRSPGTTAPTLRITAPSRLVRMAKPRLRVGSTPIAAIVSASDETIVR